VELSESGHGPNFKLALLAYELFWWTVQAVRVCTGNYLGVAVC
jgi:hypothetical protein